MISELFRSIRSKGKAWSRLTRQDRPIGTILLLWPALWSAWLADPIQPAWRDLFIIGVCVWLTRSAGCAINDWADRHIDAYVARTRSRPLITRELAPGTAVFTCVAMLLTALGLSFFLSHSVLVLLWPTAALIVFYPFSKRFFILPQMVLALTFAMAVPISWYAVSGSFSPVCWLLMAIVVIWVFSYDTIYALSDRKDDASLNIHSSALFFGDYSYTVIAIFHVLMVVGLILLGGQMQWTGYWYPTILIASLSLVYQHYLIRGDRENRFLKAFGHNGWLGLIVFIGIVLSTLQPG